MSLKFRDKNVSLWVTRNLHHHRFVWHDRGPHFHYAVDCNLSLISSRVMSHLSMTSVPLRSSIQSVAVTFNTSWLYRKFIFGNPPFPEDDFELPSKMWIWVDGVFSSERDTFVTFGMDGVGG